MSAQQLEQAQETDLSLVLGPYTGIALALLLIWLLIAFRKINVPEDDHAHFGLQEKSGGAFGRLWRNRHYRFGVVAQFLNVGAQVCAWSFTIQYAQDVVGVPASHAGWYLQASLILFLISRFVMTYLLGIIRPTKLLFAMALLGVVLALTAVLVPNMVGLDRGRRHLGLAVPDVPDDLRRRAAGPGPGHEVRGRRSGDGDPRRRPHAADHGPDHGHLRHGRPASSSPPCAWPSSPRTRCSTCAPTGTSRRSSRRAPRTDGERRRYGVAGGRAMSR